VFAAVEAVVSAPEFGEVYRQQLVPVWRYVRSRVPDHHLAEDLTSEVFARAWRSWPSFDQRQGQVGGWLFRIAQRTVIDWRRAAGRTADVAHVDLDSLEPPEPPNTGPEAAVLAREVLSELAGAMSCLNDRERDGIALRFAAGLKMTEVGEVIGLSTGATKMMISRAIARLALTMTSRRNPQPEPRSELLLDTLLDEALERGYKGLTDDGLRTLVVHLAVIHRPHMPSDLPGKVHLCIRCSTSLVSNLMARRDGTISNQARPRPASMWPPPGPLALLWAPLSPICLACTIPILVAPLTALGVSMGVNVGFHALSLVTAPLVFIVIWLHFGRHRQRLALWAGGGGALLLVIHLFAHLLVPNDIPLWSVVADQLGTILLLAGALLDSTAFYRWKAAQQTGLALAASRFELQPA
jgi:RNA polymerase sigma factor (sigma-70 family)